MQRPALVVSLSLSACGATPAPEPAAPPLPTLEQLVREQVALYPMMREQDLYKLISQATRGPSHMFMGEDSELEVGLNREIAQLEPEPIDGVPVIEVLDPREDLVRVNLRPWLLHGGTMEDLARAIGWTTLQYRGDQAVFEASLAAAAEWIDDLPVAFDREDYERYVARMRAGGFPPGLHSREYADQYEPAYRIVLLHHLTDPLYGGRDRIAHFPR